ncbi:glycosyltransferase family 4 protein [Aestuariispira ectoiniformans]|uniref:glycosyltransferase family 4 protein n=1 Tax=Aestuariispira ectoiniformans TaxID=2775080 RepID=UPI00223AA5C8|nr:glycosyltransferase family 1 protein [Aestuariispira ectoiniformans]
MRILIVSDAWRPQTNGVVRTLETTIDQITKRGHEVHMITPNDFKTLPCPTYPEIRLSLKPAAKIAKILEQVQPEYIHISTEGPLGLAARNICVKKKLGFTTSYHTCFPEYVTARFPVPLSWGYRFMRWFHGPSGGLMVATNSIETNLKAKGFENICRWSRGVDLDLFRPDLEPAIKDLPKPVFTYIGRVAVEKNLKDFLDLDLPGSKLVVGDGPALEELRRAYPSAHFTGAKYGEDLAQHYASGDVFVFPSRTDTFGLVLLEAMASGMPVAAYPVPGPLDVIGHNGPGCLGENLREAALNAMRIDREKAIAHAQQYTWAKCTDQFLENLVAV